MDIQLADGSPWQSPSYLTQVFHKEDELKNWINTTYVYFIYFDFFFFFRSGVEVDLDEQAENEAGQNRGHDNEGQVPETKRYSYSKIDILLDKLTNIFERNIRKLRQPVANLLSAICPTGVAVAAGHVGFNLFDGSRQMSDILIARGPNNDTVFDTDLKKGDKNSKSGARRNLAPF